MEIQLDRNEERLNVNKITIFIDNCEFEIELNKFKNEISIRKEQYGSGETTIIIKPRVSNDITIS